MRRTHSAGGVVLNTKGEIVVVSQRGKSWSLPKGHLDEGENKLEAAKREIAEETGLTKLTLVQELGTYERLKMNSENKDNHKELKVMTFFLFTTPQNTLSPQDKENPDARWVAIENVATLLTHPKDKTFFESVIPLIKKHLQTQKNQK